MQGTITKIVEPKFFGFIEVRGQSKDVFFHGSELDPSLEFGQQLILRRVEFDVWPSDKGPRATNIRPTI